MGATLNKIILVLLASISLAGCGQGSSSYDAEQQAMMDREYEKQLDTFDRQTDKFDEQAARFDTLLDRWEEQANRQDRLLDIQESRAAGK
jgi:hypothetical protein